MLVRDPSRLRERMDEAGLSYYSLAEAAKVTPGFISHLIPAHLPVPGPGENPCPFVWSTNTGPVRCVGADGHKGRHAATNRARRRSCKPETAHRIANALHCQTGVLFEERGPDDPSTGPLPVQPTGRRSRAGAGA